MNCLICKIKDQNVNGLCWDCYNERSTCLVCYRFRILNDDRKCKECA